MPAYASNHSGESLSLLKRWLLPLLALGGIALLLALAGAPAPSSPPRQTETATIHAARVRQDMAASVTTTAPDATQSGPKQMEVVEMDGSLDEDSGDDDPYAFHDALQTPDPGEGIRPSSEVITTAAEDEAPALPSDELDAPQRDYSASPLAQQRRQARLSAIAAATGAAATQHCEAAPDAAQPLDSRSLPEALRSSFKAPRFDVLAYDRDARRRFAIVDGVRINEGSALDAQTTLLGITADGTLLEHRGCLILIAARRH